MFSNKVSSLLFAYFMRPRKDYVRILESINASGGLSSSEIELLRASAPEFDAEAMLRHLATARY